MKYEAVQSYLLEMVSEDARVLPISLKGDRRAQRQWREVVEASSITPFVDWPISGPRTVEW
eukprot:8724537-Lingulodinium_polyedra.AAC.1